MSKHTSIRVILAISVCFRWHRKSLDVKTVFLTANLDEKICVCPPRGFDDSKNMEKV